MACDQHKVFNVKSNWSYIFITIPIHRITIKRKEVDCQKDWDIFGSLLQRSRGNESENKPDNIRPEFKKKRYRSKVIRMEFIGIFK